MRLGLLLHGGEIAKTARQRPLGKKIPAVRFSKLAFAIVFSLGIVSQANAIDCARASNAVERRICETPTLMSADKRMTLAYMRILKQARDPVVREMLVRSQRRWVKARDIRLNVDSDGNPIDITAVLDAIGDRTHVLEDQSENGLIARAQVEQRWFANYKAGDFSGFSADCDFIPESRDGSTASYTCYGDVHVERGNRLCSERQDWATWSVYTYRSVSRIDGEGSRPVAYCNNRENACDTGSAEAGWTGDASLATDDRFPRPVRGLPKLDAEMWGIVDTEWFDQCLMSPHYPDAL